MSAGAGQRVNAESSRPSRQAFAVWLVGLGIYFLAVFHRSSLAVAGLAATERFDIYASQLATFTMLQLLVYAAMQIPVGLLVDRFGSRAVLTAGAVVLTLAQTGFAFAETYPAGAGRPALRRHGRRDDLHLRAAPGQHLVRTEADPADDPGHRRVRPARRDRRRGPDDLRAVAPRLDQVLPAGRLARHRAGRAARPVVHDGPGERSRRGPRCRWPTIRASLAASWAHPGTRLGFWMHFSTQFSATTLGLLWGYPFFVRGEGQSSRPRASC